jgi:hypothetical protein
MAHELLDLPGRTEEGGLRPFFSRGFITSGIARIIVPVVRLDAQTGANRSFTTCGGQKKRGRRTKMKVFGKTLSIGVCALVLVAIFSGFAAASDQQAAGESVMITGTVNEENLIVSEEGETFGVADTEKGAELKSFEGMKIQVTGTVMEQDGAKVIDVQAYEIVKE